MGNQSGFRSSKWCQPHSNKLLPINGSITRNIDSSADACIASDFSLHDKYNHPRIYPSTLDPSYVFYRDTCWRYQKNNNNGDSITYERNNLKPAHCYISAVLLVLVWADQLGINVDTPVVAAMIGAKKRKYVSYITSTSVTKYIQVAAKATHGITATKALASFPPTPLEWMHVFLWMLMMKNCTWY